MRSWTQKDWLPLGAFLFLALAILGGYLYLEGSTTYQLIALIFLGLVSLHALHTYDLRYARLYLLFLLAHTGLYALLYRFSLPAVTVYLTVLASGTLLFSRWIEQRSWQGWRLELAGAISLAQVTLLLSLIPLALMTKAAIAMVTVAGLLEMMRYPGLDRWRVGKSYGILILLLMLLILITLYVAYA